jgi:predicted site-specific integrase-resolvase
MKKRQLPYPPPWQDAPTLCAHICISETTLDVWVRQGILPPCRPIGGKRMWKWSEVENHLEGLDGDGDETGDALRERMYRATRAATESSKRRRKGEVA